MLLLFLLYGLIEETALVLVLLPKTKHTTKLPYKMHRNLFHSAYTFVSVSNYKWSLYVVCLKPTTMTQVTEDDSMNCSSVTYATSKSTVVVHMCCYNFGGPDSLWGNATAWVELFLVRAAQRRWNAQ